MDLRIVGSFLACLRVDQLLDHVHEVAYGKLDDPGIALQNKLLLDGAKVTFDDGGVFALAAVGGEKLIDSFGRELKDRLDDRLGVVKTGHLSGWWGVRVFAGGTGGEADGDGDGGCFSRRAARWKEWAGIQRSR